MSESSSAASPIQTLYCAHHAWLLGWLRRRLGNAPDAADQAHDTFVRLMASRRIDLAGDQPRAFLTQVAKGLLIDHWRHQKIRQAYLDTIATLPPPQVPSEESRLLILEALYRIDAVLRSLPAKTRTLFLLAQLDGLSYAEIARQQGVALITVKRHMRTAFLACLQAA